MLIVTAKLPRRKLAFGAAAAALLCCAALVLNLVPAGYRAAAAPANIPSSRGIRPNTDRVAPRALTWSGTLAGGSGATPMRSPIIPPGSPAYRPT